MTRPAHYTEKMTDFSLWIRNECKDSKEGLSLTNLDFVVTDYRQRLVMLVEEKTHGVQTVSYGQRQIFNLLNRALKLYSESDLEGWKYLGFFLVSFSGTGPDDSERITINHVTVTREQLRRFMNFEMSLFELNN